MGGAKAVCTALSLAFGDVSGCTSTGLSVLCPLEAQT